METPIIKEIKEKIEQTEEALKNFIPNQHREKRYGIEKEHSAQSLKAGLKAILIDIRGLVRAHQRFVQLSTYQERTDIKDTLSRICSTLNEKNYPNIVSDLDILKPIIRNYCARRSSETQDILAERVDKLHAQCAIAEENLDTTNRIREQAEKAEQNLQSSEKNNESINNIISDLNNKASEITKLQEKSEEQSETIAEILTSAKSHEEIINSFSQKVETRQKQLDEQEVMTREYEKKLKLYTEERKDILEEANELINQARNALRYKTVEGISAAFDARYTEEKEKGKKSWLWLASGVAFVVTGIGIEMCLLLGSQDTTIGATILQITILPFTFMIAYFCAMQYIRYKNILDDYGYKSVLARSIIAFLDQFQKPEEREYYLQTVLKEIHQDPLRKKHDINIPISKFFESKKNKDLAQ